MSKNRKMAGRPVSAIGVALLAALCVLTAQGFADDESPPLPNIVFILADDNY